MLKGFSCFPCALLSVRLSLCVGVRVPSVGFWSRACLHRRHEAPLVSGRPAAELPLGSSLRRPGPRPPDGQPRPAGPACAQPLCPWAPDGAVSSFVVPGWLALVSRTSSHGLSCCFGQAGRGERWDACWREVRSVRTPPRTCARVWKRRQATVPSSERPAELPQGVWEPRASRRRWRSPVCAPRRGTAGVWALCVSVVSCFHLKLSVLPCKLFLHTVALLALVPIPLRFGGPPRSPLDSVVALFTLCSRAWVCGRGSSPGPLLFVPILSARQFPALPSFFF